MTRAEEFIQLFNRLSDHLMRVTGRNHDYSFSALVDRAAERNLAVRAEAQQLKDYGDLRNAIVHHRAFPPEIIAEPSAKALADFDSLVERVLSPRLLIPAFSAQVRPFSTGQKLLDALRYMGENDFSQIIVRESGKLRLLTVEGIAHWVERQTDDPIIDVSDATVNEALRFEGSGGFRIMKRSDTVYEARETFTGALERKQPRIFALIVTENGKATEKPLGIVTPWDLLDGEEH